MTTSWFPDPSSNRISVFSWIMLSLSFGLLLMLNVSGRSGNSPSEAQKQGLFESLPPQVLDFSLGAGSY